MAPISLRLSAQESLGKTKPIFLLRRAKIPWNGSGTFVLAPSFSPEVDGTTIEAGRYNGLTSDIAAGITGALAKDGQNAATGNIPMGGNKITGLGTGTLSTDAVRYDQIAGLAQTGYAALTTLSPTTGAVTLDTQLVNNLIIPTGNVTFTFSNARASGSLTMFALIVQFGGTGYTITWPASVRWPGGSVPTLSGANKIDLFAFFSRDGGTTWFGSQTVRGWSA